MTKDTPHRELRWRAGIPLLPITEQTLFVGDRRVSLRLSDAELQWLTSTARTRSDLEGTCPSGVDRARMILDSLRTTGALASATECWWLSPTDRERLQPHLLSLSEWHADPEAAIAARTSWRIAVQGFGSTAKAISRLLRASGLALADARDCDLLIVVGAQGIHAPEALIPEEDLDAHALDPRAHLPVSVYRAHASIGPLIIPGRTACLNCMHLHRRDRDPLWPTLVEQWRAVDAAEMADADPLLAWQAASTAVAMVRHWIDSAHAAHPHRIRWRFPHPVPTLEALTPHPSCGCGWAGNPHGPATGGHGRTR